MEYWTNTNSKMNIFRRDVMTSEIECYLIDAKGVDPYVIASDLKINVGIIMRWQRELGLRKMSTNGTEKRYHLNMGGHGKRLAAMQNEKVEKGC